MKLYLENMKKKPSKNSLFSKISFENGSRTVKNPQQNTSKPNPTTHKKNFMAKWDLSQECKVDLTSEDQFM